MSNTKTTHLNWLEWINGSWYYEHNVFAIVLSDFEVDQDTLTSEHKHALDKVASAYNEADVWNNASVSPESISYETPFGVGQFGSVDIGDILDWPNIEGISDAWDENNHIGVPLHSDELIDRYENAESLHSFVARDAIRVELSSKHPFGFLKFQGGASQTGTDDHNDNLSWRRAEAVRRYLWDAHSVNADDLGETEGFGETEPYIDAIAEGLDNIEIDQNRYTRFIFSYTYKVAVLDSPRILRKRLSDTLTNIEGMNDSTERKEVNRDHAIGKYALGMKAWQYVHEFHNTKATKWYPDETVISVKNAIWMILEDELNEFAFPDRPTIPNHRYSKAEDKRKALMMSLQSEWDTVQTNKEKGWEKICLIAGEDPSIRFSLILDFISEEKYRTLMTEEDRLNVWHLFDTIEEWAMSDHFERLRPNFLWLDLELNEKVEGIQREAGTSLDVEEIRWVLPKND